jgi:hypothetical protein
VNRINQRRKLALSMMACVLLSGNASAADEACPNEKPLKPICLVIGEHMKDRSGRNDWLFMTRFNDAACIDEANDADAVQDEKLQKTWRQLEPRLVCNTLGLDGINLLKFAIVRNNSEFVDWAIDRGLNLNMVDKSDQMTVLDFVEREKARYADTALYSRYQMWEYVLKKGGAKRAADVK